MESKNLELERAVLEAIGAKEGKLFPSGWVLEAIMPDDRIVMVFINERSSSAFKDNVYTFSDAWMENVKDYPENALICVAEKGNSKGLYIIDPNDPTTTGFNNYVSLDEFGDPVYSYVKLK